MNCIVGKNARELVLGVSCSVLLAACGGSGGGSSGSGEVEVPEVFVQAIPASQQRVVPTEEARPFRPEGPHAAVLKDCALADSENICTLAELPFIGQTDTALTLESVMERVVVSHDWMGVRFEQLMRRMPADLIDLFAPVTAIVIGSEIRPSFYSGARGIVGIDPVYLWMSVPEKQTIAVEQDFRTDFGPDLKFKAFWRLASGDNYATPFHSLLDDSVRDIDDLDISLARLLYHELAHANDFVQNENLDTLPLDIMPWEAAQLLESSTVWRALYADEQLTAQTSLLYGLAAVRFNNATPTEFQSNVLADVVGSEMGNEGKSLFYGYSSTAEDVATLFAAAMMKFHYDVDYHVGLVNKLPDGVAGSCDDYKVEWGVRNRLASPLVVPRAKFVVDRIMQPSAALDQFFANGSGTAAPLQVGRGWCESLSSNPQIAKQDKASIRPPMELDAEHIGRYINQ